MARPRGRSFPPGNNANPRGRPPGIKEARPRNFVGNAIRAVLATEPDLLKSAILSGLKNQRVAHQWADLVAKVGKEIGSGAAGDVPPVVINLYSNLNPMALAARRLLPPPKKTKELPHAIEKT